MKAPKEAWVACGFDLLTNKGPTALKVDYLCRSMSLTKGAFYHHFDGLADYQQTLLDAWEQAHTEAIIQAVSALKNNTDQRALLTSMANSKDQQLENAFRAWALYDEGVARRLSTVDERRIEFIHQLLLVDVMPGIDAQVASRVVYAHFVGWQQLNGTLTQRDFEQMEALLKQLLVVPGFIDRN